MTANGMTLGIDIGGTKVLGVALDVDGTVCAETRVPSAVAEGGVSDAITQVFRTLLAQVGSASAVGIGIAGLVDFDGRMRFGPNLPDILALPIREQMEAVTGLAVTVDNDANAAGFGELTHGSLRGARHALMVTLGTGIGGAILIDGEVFRGANGFAAEIGHFTVRADGPICACGERGHWEAIACGPALGRMGLEAVRDGRGGAILAVAGDEPISAHHVASAAMSGDADALEIMSEFGDNVALGLAGLANILDPEIIAIAGGLVEMGPLLFDPLERAFSAHLEGLAYRPRIPVVPAQLGERAGAIGAAAQARHAMLR